MTLLRPWPVDVVDTVVSGMTALREPWRLRLVEILDRTGPRHVQALADAVGTTQQNASKHLAVLRAAGLLQRHREGRLVWYAVAGSDVYACVEQTAPCCYGICLGVDRTCWARWQERRQPDLRGDRCPCVALVEPSGGERPSSG